jgi:hypothetical protein
MDPVKKMVENKNDINTVPEPFKIQVPQETLDDLNRRLETTIWADDEEGAYAMIQSTKPQTLSYGLNDSPIGLAAWIIEKFRT